MIKRLIAKKSGLSLVEVIVALALLSLIVVMLFSVVMVSFDSITANAKLKRSDSDAAAGLEHDFAGDSDHSSQIRREDGQFVIDFGDGGIVTANGEQVISKDEKEGSLLRFFEVN